MKAAVLHGYDEALTGETFATYEDVDDPKIAAPTDVIVRVGGAGVCRTDLHLVEGDLPLHRAGVIPGHEIVGRFYDASAGDLFFTPSGSGQRQNPPCAVSIE